jgi:hypothetical protein
VHTVDALLRGLRRPLFHNGTVVALNTWTFRYRCWGPNLEYRVDSAAARRFLSANL